MSWLPWVWRSEVQRASQLKAERAEEECGEAEVCAGGRIAVLALGVALGLLAQDALVAGRADAPLVLVAGAAVLANQELLITDIGCQARRGRERKKTNSVGSCMLQVALEPHIPCNSKHLVAFP